MDLSKSDYMAARQCLKRLWLQRHEPDLGSPLSPSTLHRMRQGNLVGELARGLFPGGVTAPYRGLSEEEAAEATRHHLASDAPAVFEATVGGDGAWARIDVLERRPDGWALYEVKSSTKPKDEHVEELAFETMCAERAGLEVASIGLLTLDTTYVLPADALLDPTKLFAKHDAKDAVRLLMPHIEVRWREAAEAAEGAMPHLEMGRQCTSPYTCPYYDHCDESRPDDDISRLYRITGKEILQFRQQGVFRLGDIPTDAKLRPIQHRILNAVRFDQPFVAEALADDLRQVRYPAFFVDFEGASVAVPRIVGTRPYQTMLFQWSSHRIDHPGADPTHHEHLHVESSDPRPEFVARLLDHLGPSGTFLHYAEYELTQIRAMALDGVPGAERLLDRVRADSLDLHKVVQEHTYLPSFEGSFSIKNVLPAVCPELRYDGMEIADGETAAVEWLRMTDQLTPPNEREIIARRLREYCALDTLAMVRVWEWLHRVSPAASGQA